MMPPDRLAHLRNPGQCAFLDKLQYERLGDGSQRRSHAFECTRYLFGTEAGAEVVDHHLPQGRTGNQPARHPGQRGLCISPLLRPIGPIPMRGSRSSRQRRVAPC